MLADTPTGRPDRTVVVGAHLDSVDAGPGVNDNGSGTAAILEVAKQMAALRVQPTNRVRFAFWGAEEFGLLGAEHYLANLPKAELKNLMLNLNFDMVGSPNYVRFVYDGDGSATGTKGPSGSGNIERVFLDYFASQRLPTAPTAFDGRSDYGPFIDRGIPAGGLFTGAEGIKSAAEAAVYGGTEEWPTPVLPRGVRHLSDQRQLDGARPDGGRDRRCDPAVRDDDVVDERDGQVLLVVAAVGRRLQGLIAPEVERPGGEGTCRPSPLFSSPRDDVGSCRWRDDRRPESRRRDL